MDAVRIDKWLWAARFFKTRALATKACQLQRVQSEGQPVKPARDVNIGDHLRIETEGGIFEVEVLGLSEDRGPAVDAQKLYRETDQSKAARARVAEERRLNREFSPAPLGRPSKRDRRRIIQFRGRR
ncbi:MAG TPA: RNA-binding S4 domain-containing protein [Candidatus Koribacter sp.]|jgi:ribosome-associated heat shock protein Hsp15